MWFVVAVAATAVTMAVAVSVVATLNPKPQFTVAEKIYCCCPAGMASVDSTGPQESFRSPGELQL